MLEEAADSFDELVQVIANKTEHTKLLVEKQLNELRQMHDRPAIEAWVPQRR